MPSQSKSQQRFFGVVKAMQKGDIPKKGRAGKIAKSMDKDDVDKFAKTKHKGLPNKVKREQRVRNLIKKMVREELTQMDEKVTGQYKVSPKVQMHWGMDKVVIISGNKRVVLNRKEMKSLMKGVKANKLTEEKLNEKIEPSKAVKKVLDMADGGFGKLGGRTVDGLSANLFKAVYNKANDTNLEKINKMNEKQLYTFMTKIWSKFGKQVRL
jgi:hypothetical protein